MPEYILEGLSPLNCPYPDGNAFINAVNAGTSAFASTKAGNSTKFITEIIVTGTCSNGAAWDITIPQSQINISVVSADKVNFRFNPPVTSNNEYTVTIRVLTPCVSGTCGPITNYREVLSPSAFTIKSPAAGSTFQAPKLLAGGAEDKCG